MLLTPFIPSFAAFVMGGCYKIPTVQTDVIGVFTNKFADRRDPRRRPARGDAPDRGDGGPARRRARAWTALEVRRKNFIPKEDFPAEIAVGRRLRLGRLPRLAGQAARELRPRRVPRASRRSCASEGKYRGVGFSTYMEICGLAPSRVVGPSGVGIQGGFWESAHRARAPDRRGDRLHGASPHGQGHETGFAQIVADRLGVDPEQVEVIHGDTDTGPYGMGTYGSRSLAVGGEAIAPRGRQGRRQGQADRAPTCSRPRPRTSSCATASSRCAARPTRA